VDASTEQLQKTIDHTKTNVEYREGLRAAGMRERVSVPIRIDKQQRKKMDHTMEKTNKGKL